MVVTAVLTLWLAIGIYNPLIIPTLNIFEFESNTSPKGTKNEVVTSKATMVVTTSMTIVVASTWWAF
jgi:hypothetical protein